MITDIVGIIVLALCAFFSIYHHFLGVGNYTHFESAVTYLLIVIIMLIVYKRRDK
jgi:heme exporter protein D